MSWPATSAAANGTTMAIEPAIRRDHGINTFQPQQPRPPVHEAAKLVSIAPDMVGTVQPATGKCNRRVHQAAAFFPVTSASTAFANSRCTG